MTTKAKAKNEATEAIEAAVETSAAATEAVAQASSETVVKSLEQTMAVAKEQADKANAMAVKSLDDVSKIGRSTYENWLKTSETLAKGMEQVNKTMLGFAQHTLDANMNTARQLMSCASVNEAVSIQSSHLKSTFDSMLAEGSKVGEIATSTLTDAFAPINAQFKDGIEKIWKPLAA